MYGKNGSGRYATGSRTEPTDPYANPYQQRRGTARAQAIQNRYPSATQQPTQTASAAPARTPSTPLRIVVPNLEAAQQKGGTMVRMTPAPRVSTPAYQPPPPVEIASAEPVISPPEYGAAEPRFVADAEPSAPPIEKSFAAPKPLSTTAEYSAQSVMARAVAPLMSIIASIAPESPAPAVKTASVQIDQAEQFAALAPAAGEPAPTVPLIAAPQQPAAPTPEEKPEAPTAPVPAAPVAPKAPEPKAAAPAPEPVAQPASEPAASPASATLDEALQTAAPEPKAETPVVPKKKPMTKKEPEAPKATKVAAPVKPLIEEPPATEAAETPSEPAPTLSAASKTILDKINPKPDAPKKGKHEPLSIDRAKDTQEISEGSPVAETASVHHESMGIKIEVKSRPVNYDYELEKAYNALIAGQTDVAVAIYKSVLENNPSNKGALFGLATTYHRSGQIDMARPYYGKLLSIDPQNRDGLNNFLVLLADEAPEEALSQMEKLEAKNPGFSPIPAQMAIIYQKLGKTELAGEKMLKAITLAPENLTYRYNLAIMLDKQHKYEQAMPLYRQLIEAQQRGEAIPGNVQKIQERLTFISSNRP